MEFTTHAPGERVEHDGGNKKNLKSEKPCSKLSKAMEVSRITCRLAVGRTKVRSRLRIISKVFERHNT